MTTFVGDIPTATDKASAFFWLESAREWASKTGAGVGIIAVYVTESPISIELLVVMGGKRCFVRIPRYLLSKPPAELERYFHTDLDRFYRQGLSTPPITPPLPPVTSEFENTVLAVEGQREARRMARRAGALPSASMESNICRSLCEWAGAMAERWGKERALEFVEMRGRVSPTRDGHETTIRMREVRLHTKGPVHELDVFVPARARCNDNAYLFGALDAAWGLVCRMPTVAQAVHERAAAIKDAAWIQAAPAVRPLPPLVAVQRDPARPDYPCRGRAVPDQRGELMEDARRPVSCLAAVKSFSLRKSRRFDRVIACQGGWD